MRHHLTEYLSFGKSERIAIVSVILLIILLIFLPSLYKSLLKPLQTMDTSFEAEITAFLSQEDNMAGTDSKNFDYSNPDRAVFRSGITPFIFDPNTLEKKDWIKMGFTEKQASGIVRYREKGGMFRKKEDLKKLYAVTEDVYCILEPFISIKSNNHFPDNASPDGTKEILSTKTYPERYKAELNSADSAELVKVYGIGPATARRIIRYRSRLGGFASVDQLREVAGIDSTRFVMIKEGLFADHEVIVKIEINKASISQLRQHPYIDYYIAKAIVDTRIRKGAYTSPDELKEIPLIYEELFRKLKPYISISQ
ncbi:MAG: helix-hairpin-helix domain-containing protein [Bacteroidales bacterium]|nr:helix-hairpin-helix domain-containing protein [Bacteroidales bacterium]